MSSKTVWAALTHLQGASTCVVTFWTMFDLLPRYSDIVRCTLQAPTSMYTGPPPENSNLVGRTVLTIEC